MPLITATHDPHRPTPAEQLHRRAVLVAAPIGARFPRHLAGTTREATLVTRSETRPAHPVGARFPRLAASRRAEVREVEVVTDPAPRPAVGARYPRPAKASRPAGVIGAVRAALAMRPLLPVRFAG